MSELALTKLKLVPVKSGTIVFPKSGAAVNTNNRAVITKDGFLVSHLMGVDVDPQMAETAWVYWALCQIDMTEYSDNDQYPSLKQSVVEKIEIPLPPLPEQKRIAAILNERLAAVEQARKASLARLKAARALPAAYLREVFESEEAKGWPTASLSDLVVSNLRTGISKPEKSDSIHKCLTLSSIRDGALLADQAKPVDVTEGEAEKNQVKPGGFYVVRGNGNRTLVGRGGIASSENVGQVFPDLLFEVIPDPKTLSIAFLRWAWDSRLVRDQIEDKSKTAAGIYKINQKNLGSIELPCPPLELQEQIASELSSRNIRAVGLQDLGAEELSAINAMPASLLRQAFSGAL